MAASVRSGARPVCRFCGFIAVDLGGLRAHQARNDECVDLQRRADSVVTSSSSDGSPRSPHGRGSQTRSPPRSFFSPARFSPGDFPGGGLDTPPSSPAYSLSDNPDSDSEAEAPQVENKSVRFQFTELMVERQNGQGHSAHDGNKILSFIKENMHQMDQLCFDDISDMHTYIDENILPGDVSTFAALFVFSFLHESNEHCVAPARISYCICWNYSEIFLWLPDFFCFAMQFAFSFKGRIPFPRSVCYGFPQKLKRWIFILATVCHWFS
jgi:hypothetical protein